MMYAPRPTPIYPTPGTTDLILINLCCFGRDRYPECESCWVSRLPTSSLLRSMKPSQMSFQMIRSSSPYRPQRRVLSCRLGRNIPGRQCHKSVGAKTDVVPGALTVFWPLSLRLKATLYDGTHHCSVATNFARSSWKNWPKHVLP